MGETANSEGTSNEPEKPVLAADVFPPFPEPTDNDFEEDIALEERNFYKTKFNDLKVIKFYRLHCTACDRHLGCSAKNESRMRAHPMLRTLVCHTCHTFYNSGEFDKGDDGSELYCRWCGQGGQVYCCSDCPHVFCAKCIKRNLGMPKIKEIENTDDWKCFKCNPKCLWDLRALCWALLRYCDLKNKITYTTQDPELKELYQKDCAVDHSECCKNKTKRKSKDDVKKKIEADTKKAVIPKIPPTIQVKKFATMVDDTVLKQEKKPQKRPISPKMKPIYIKNPISVAPGPVKSMNLMQIPPPAKKMKMPNTNFMQPVRFPNMEKKTPIATYTRIKPIQRPTLQMPILTNHFNGFNNVNTYYNDNINLSLESLTQGLDMAAVSSIGNNGFQNDDVVCTPDFPLEPLCEVTEDNNDDDVQCITPGPVAAPKVNTNTPPPLIPRAQTVLPDGGTSDNIIQMTENDVTVNAATGGLKFRVDPQTLSSNKMYRLPDGRIFAINANPAMPGGYSATIVAVTENLPGKVAPKGPTYAAKLSAVGSQSTSTPVSKPNRSSVRSTRNRISALKSTSTNRVSDTSRSFDLDVPVEWFRYNLLDAVDSLEYSLSRLNKLKKEATSMHLRSRTIPEMKNLHKTLDRLLHTSSTRFNEIRENLNKEMKQYIMKKTDTNISEDDDDVEILNDGDDDPIFIDENSVESAVNETNCDESHEVDLTIVSSDHNDSAENKKSAHNSNNDQGSCIVNDEKRDNEGDASNTIHNMVNENENSVEAENKEDENDKGKNTEEVEKNNPKCGKEIKEKSNKMSKFEDEKESSSNEDGNVKTEDSNVKTEDGNVKTEDGNVKSDESKDSTKKGSNMETDEGELSSVVEKNNDRDVEKEHTDISKKENILQGHDNNDVEMKDPTRDSSKEEDEEKKLLNDDRTDVDKDGGKIQDSEMSDEMIENLLNDDTTKEEILGT